MIARITSDGSLAIEPVTEQDEYALKQWLKENDYRLGGMNIIIFVFREADALSVLKNANIWIDTR